MATLVDEFPTPYVSVKVDLAAGNTTKTLVAAPPAGRRIRVYKIKYISKTSAAQVLNVAAGSTNVLNLAASIAAHAEIDTDWLEGGLAMPAATALIATPGAAGPAGSFYLTYTIE